MPSLGAKLAKVGLNWLLLALPVAALAELAHARSHAAWASPLLIFIASALAIVPLAGWMGRATEHLAARLGEGVGGLLNATFGNAAELIIAVMALYEGVRQPGSLDLMHSIVKASLTGSIIGNLLLVLGVSLLAGGLKHRVQSFNPTATRANATLLLLATIAMVIPALFSYFAREQGAKVLDLSLELSVLLLVAYALSLVFALKTHKEFYAGEEEEAEEEEAHEPWPVRRAVGVLLAATVGVAVLAELMVGSVHEASVEVGLTELFVGVIVVAIVGNAAEHSTAVMVALRDRMDLSLGIAIGSSIQIALFVAPVLVLASYCFGTPMDLVFTVPEIAAIAISVAAVSQIAGDGQSHWLEGAMLLTIYVMMAALFFYLPA